MGKLADAIALLTGSAKAGEDYTAENASWNIAAGDLEYKIVVDTIDDSGRELTENFTIGLANMSGGIGRDSTGQGTISDNDPIPTLSIAPATATEGSQAEFEVSLSHTTYEDVSFEYFSVDGTAKAGEDYNLTGSTGEIQAGSLSTTIAVDPSR